MKGYFFAKPYFSIFNGLLKNFNFIILFISALRHFFSLMLIKYLAAIIRVFFGRLSDAEEYDKTADDEKKFDTDIAMVD
jgi:hypothetical protein